ncbi:hypothetical protein NM208_g12775 [Fusarium decemcellulare]|uniref:Uncharacterized protein n=1 Tax=Fusarium decemcellulare TaxID=57161 RepID=A0ACC1RPW6_9HYPO|nr:hypothetical protein NM208_g12775 [Fusarium decemcellulare]
MRLLNAKTRAIEQFMDHEVPKYVILSHRWTEEEVSFQDMQGSGATQKLGYAKITNTCDLALRDGLEYAWIDTCCIDKTSSEELSEAINSMMSWYQRSKICYTYMADVSPDTDLYVPGSSFETSQWFTRGWTLQELLAPSSLVFLASDWSVLSTRDELASLVGEITGIDVSFLSLRQVEKEAGGNTPDTTITLRSMLNSASIAERMSWASKRETTRQEDMAYCLLGIFGINMPLLYGEGKNAFMRLQEEIMKHSDDQSLLSWNFRDDGPSEAGVLATSPAAFSRCKDIVPCDVGMPTPPFSITNKGLRIEVPLSNGDDLGTIFTYAPKRNHASLNIICGRNGNILQFNLWSEWKYSSVYLIPNLAFANNIEEAPVYTVYLRNIPTGYDIKAVYPSTYHRVIGSRIVMKGDLSGYDKDGVLILLNNEGDHAESLILSISVWEQESYLSGDSRQEFNLDISCTLMGSSNKQDISLARLWQKDTSYRLRHLHTPEGRFDTKSSRESYFGKTLFCIDITQGEELTWSNVSRVLSADWNGHPGLPALRENWLRSLKESSAYVRTKLYAVLRFLGLSPWMFTFFVECLIGRVFVHVKTGIKHVWKNWDRYAIASTLLCAARYAVGPQRVAQVLARILKIPSVSRILYTLRNSTVDILALYLCCKMLPSQFLTAVSKTNGSLGAR